MKSKETTGGIRFWILRNSKAIRGGNWPRWFVLAAGGALLFAALSQLSMSRWKAGVFESTDPLFGVPLRSVVLVITLLQIVAAVVCLFSRRYAFAAGLAGWVVLNIIVYRIGLWTTGWRHPYSSVFWLTDGVGMSPWTADVIAAIVGVCIVSGCIVIVRKFSALNPDRLKMSCPSCGGHIKFFTQNLGQTIPCPHCRTRITLRRPDESLKISCYFCKGHIEFPAYSLGQKMQCPHCKMDITLKLPEAVSLS